MISRTTCTCVLAFTVLLLSTLFSGASGAPEGTGDTPGDTRPRVFLSPVPFDTSAVVYNESASTDDLLESAREMFIADNLTLSEMLYKSVLVREPNNLSAMLELSIVYEKMGRLQYARGLLTRASILSPYDEDIINRTVEVVKKMSRQLEIEVDSLMANRSYEAAIPKLALLLTTQPENADLYYRKAQCHLELGRPAIAIAEIDKALRLQKDERFYEFRAHAAAMQETREVEQMTEHVKALLKTGTPESTEAALRTLGEILQADPENAWARARFLELTGGEPSTEFTPTPSLPTAAIRDAVKRVSSAVWRASVVVASVLGDHIGLLLGIFLALVLLNSPLTRALVRGAEPHQPLSGTLDKFSIQEVLMLINTHHRTGTLRVKSDTVNGRIYFNSGEIYHCRAKKLGGREALQHILKNAEQGRFTFAESRRSNETSIDTPLSLILLELPERKTSITSKSILENQKKRSKMKTLLETKNR
jgi:tetratricopeptide (TPR) repeat protein